MVDVTARIKNLSIALEAVSKSILSLKNYNRISRIEDLLDDALTEAETQTDRPPARSAATTTDDDIPY